MEAIDGGNNSNDMHLDDQKNGLQQKIIASGGE